MKKVLSVLMVAVALMMITPAHAQLIKFGVKGGLNFSKLDLDAKSFGDVKDNSTGFFIGPMAEFTLPVLGLGVDGALMYSQRGSGDYKEQGIEIPVNLKYTIGLGSIAGIYFAAGPDFFFNFNGKKEGEISDVVVNGNPATVEFATPKKAQVAVNLGAGLKLLKKLQIGITYQIPMGDSFEWSDVSETIGNFGAKSKTWQVSAAVIF